MDSVNLDQFLPQSRSSWLGKINSDLKGKMDASQFKYKIEEGLEVSSFLSENKENYLPILGPKTQAGVYIHKDDTPKMNEKAQSLLQGGADTLCIDIDEDTDFDVLFKGVFLEMVPIFFDINGNVEKTVSNWQKYDNVHNKGNEWKVIFNSPSGNPRLYLDDSVSFVGRMQNLAAFFSEKVNVNNYQDAIVKVKMKRDFAAQVSEFRAIRVLWANVLKANEWPFIPLQLIAELGDKSYFDPEIHPLIVCNYQMMSAHLGMADWCFGWSEDDFNMERLCLNIQHILRQESHVNAVTDPMAGSYLIEEITDLLVTKAWETLSKTNQE